jgi:hypothetical protein
MTEQAKLELPLSILLHTDPQEGAGDVEKTPASSSTSLKQKSNNSIGKF